MKYYIYIENRMIAEVEDSGAAWTARAIYHKTCELADLLGKTANLVDGETGEVLESSDDYSEDCEPADIDSDMGFDPYMGCFSDDC